MSGLSTQTMSGLCSVPLFLLSIEHAQVEVYVCIPSSMHKELIGHVEVA